MYVLAIDCGTQSLRGVVFDHSGKTLIRERELLAPYFGVEPGFAEQEAAVFWEALCAVAGRVMAAASGMDISIDGVTVTTQRDAVVLLDAGSEVLRPVIIWADQRKVAKARPMAWHHSLAFRVAGLRRTVEDLSRNFKGHWLQEHEPEVWSKVDKYVQLSAWLNYKLTGKLLDSVASQVGHIPFCYKHGRWEKQHSLKHDVFHIDNRLLCDLVQPGTVLGGLTEAAACESGLPAGIPVVASGSDKGCETLGVGCGDLTVASLSLGSQACVQTTSERYFETLRFIPPFPAVVPGMYNPEIQVYRGFWMLSRFLEEMGLDDTAEMEAALASVPAGSEGLILHPYWGAGIKMPEAKGAVLGFTDTHRKAHIYKAMIEGILFALKDGMGKIERKSGVRIERVMVSGGGSRSDAVCQMAADVTGRPVHRVQTWETSALGASVAGYVGLGVFSGFDEGIEAMVHPQEAFLPDAERVAVYERIFESVYSKLYRRLLPIYRRM